MKLIETGIKKSSGGIQVLIATRDEQPGHNRRDAERDCQLCGPASIRPADDPFLSPSFGRRLGAHVSGSLLVVRAKSYEIFHFSFVTGHFPLFPGWPEIREMTG